MELLSRMSRNQTAELKELERDYEAIVDENTRTYACFLKEVLDGNETLRPPALLLTLNEREEEAEQVDLVEANLMRIESGGLGNGRHNPIWIDGSPSAEFDRSASSGNSSITRSPLSYPQRASPTLISGQGSHRRNSSLSSGFEFDAASSTSDDGLADSSSDSEAEERNEERTLNRSSVRKQKQPISEEASCAPEPVMEVSDNVIGAGKRTPPKDFVCPITSHVFVDPVTLETGQTYERKAIQEWLDRGNSTCPITRQQLQNTQLPKTNYVLKRLIASWLEQNPGSKWAQAEIPAPKSPPVAATKPSSSPTSVIRKANVDGTIGELRIAISNLCMSEILNASEMAVLRIERFWQDANTVPEIQTSLLKPPVINGFVEVLFNSVDPRVLRTTVFLLTELASRDKDVIQTLTAVESDVDCIVALFKKGLVEAVVLIYLLRPTLTNLVEMTVIESLLMVIKKKEEYMYEMCFRPKTASILLLGQILRSTDENMSGKVARTVVSERALESVVGSLESELMEERISAIGILVKCIEEDGHCRNLIADKAQLATVLECFVSANDGQRFEVVHFLSELVKLNRRTFNKQLLHIIKDEGAFSTMHTLLIYLQTALQDQRPVIAGLLLQLDLLVEPRKMSIYREEAIDALISCLRDSEFPDNQLVAAEMIMTLQGRFSSSGKPLLRALLLKRAGFEKAYKVLMRGEQQSHVDTESKEILEEEKASDEWEKKMAFVLVSHEFGLLFEALSEGLDSSHAELSHACLVCATWLIHMLTILPDTGIKGAARVCLLKKFIHILKSSKDSEEKALAMLALSGFMDDPDGLQDLTINVKGVLKILRNLKKCSNLASEMLKVLSKGQDSSVELWSHTKLVQVDCSANGDVLAVTSFRDKIFSGHSDGVIKVWTGRGSLLHLTSEVQEHSKAVTSLVVLQSGEKLYSGSLDKSIRAWSVGEDDIQCIQIYDVKDQVHNLVVANTISCFIPQGAGVKVQSWSGSSKMLNPHKHVRCLALVQGKLYCGCNDNSVQEIDLVSGTLSTIQPGARKLLGKTHPIYAIQCHSGLLYSASPPVDGAPVKIWSTSNYNMVGSLQTTLDVRAMAVSSELIYLGCKVGTIEIWSAEKHNRIGSLQTGSNGKIHCMAVNEDGDILVVGTSDGQIQAWGLS
ncbi:putative E3 ubiquitin-protein ligase LIN [Aristolochia californica]|uniref:putative E3 ubiquitin-protein ligase LIN n=1 Tax=Aristolochia californica TaxID=171875 RepID=UPI0035DD07CF